MITSVDTNIILDVLVQDKDFYLFSKTLLDKYSSAGQLIICEIVYAELACQFSSSSELNTFLADTEIKLVFSDEKSLSLAGEKWKLYLKNRKKAIQCSNCGEKISFNCPQCNKPVSFRQHIISDFIIGAHAFIRAEFFLSRDRGFYKTYFPDIIKEISPEYR